MFEFKYSPEALLYAETKYWSFHMDQPDNGLFRMKIGKDFILESLPAVLGEYSENLALPGKRRPHLLSHGEELGLDAQSAIPFGTEPAINRKYRISEGELSVVTDFVLRHSHPMDKLSAGGLKIDGKIQRIGIVAPPQEGCEVPSPDWVDFTSAVPESVFFDSAIPPLSVIFETSDGDNIRFTVGEDYWRWINAARMNAVSRFRILKDSTGPVLFTWDILEWQNTEEEPPHGRNWRLTWGLEWMFHGRKKTKKKPKVKAVFDMAEQAWKSDSLCVNSDGETEKFPCAASAGVLNALKRWLRSQLSDAENGDIFAVLNASAHFCRSAAHMERPKLKSLSHYDAYSLQEFRRWANKQLAPSGARLVICEGQDISE